MAEILQAGAGGHALPAFLALALGRPFRGKSKSDEPFCRLPLG